MPDLRWYRELGVDMDGAAFNSWRRSGVLLLGVLLAGAAAPAVEMAPGKVVEISFPDSDLPPSLYTMATGNPAPPSVMLRLPDNYRRDQRYPLLVYVPGFHGGPSGNIGNAQTMAGPEDWIVASLPLFKGDLEPDEIGGGLIVGFEDYPTLSRAYGVMLGRLFELVPNIDIENSAMVGFSNGAQAIAVLVSCHDAFVLDHFKSFCLVDHGMFHLTDLHKKGARESRFLVLSGDKEDLGRELKIRGGQLLQDSWRLLGVDLSFQIMKDTGHEFEERHMKMVGRWLRRETSDGGVEAPPSGTTSSGP